MYGVAVSMEVMFSCVIVIGIKSLVAETDANSWLVSFTSTHYCVAFTARYAYV